MTKREEETGRRAPGGQHPRSGNLPRREPAALPDHVLRRRMLGRLRDAHAAASLRIETLRRCPEVAASPSLRSLLFRLLEQAEEQLHRLEHAFASLREEPGGGDARMAADPVTDMLLLLRHGGSSGPVQDGALAEALRLVEVQGADEAEALKLLAHAVGLHLVARLLDLTAQERRAAARELAAFTVAGRSVAGAPASSPCGVGH